MKRFQKLFSMIVSQAVSIQLTPHFQLFLIQHGLPHLYSHGRFLQASKHVYVLIFHSSMSLVVIHWAHGIHKTVIFPSFCTSHMTLSASHMLVTWHCPLLRWSQRSYSRSGRRAWRLLMRNSEALARDPSTACWSCWRFPAHWLFSVLQV